MKLLELIDRYFQRRSISKRINILQNTIDERMRLLSYIDELKLTKEKELLLAAYIIGQCKPFKQEILELKEKLNKL